MKPADGELAASAPRFIGRERELAILAGALSRPLFRALAELVGALPARLLVVEDVHWADEATMQFPAVPGRAAAGTRA